MDDEMNRINTQRRLANSAATAAYSIPMGMSLFRSVWGKEIQQAADLHSRIEPEGNLYDRGRHIAKAGALQKRLG